jgi:serine/threonine protein phosphatase PrpC
VPVVPDAVVAGDESLAIWAPPGSAQLRLTVGCASGAASGKLNEDFFGVAQPPADPAQGIVIALADGISADGGGRVAAEMTIRTLLHDFYATSPDWSTSVALDRLLAAANDWLDAQNRRRTASGAVAALSVVVLRANHYYLAHVGDTRVYRMRGAVLKQLTIDHTWPRRDMRHVLKRAVGLDNHLVVDFADGELRPGDIFLLVSDGVWDVLGDPTLRATLCEERRPASAASRLVREALAQQAAYMGRNDATALVAAIQAAA